MGPHTPSHTLGAGPLNPVLGSNLPFASRAPGWGAGGRASQEDAGILKGPGRVASEVKLIQVPCVLTTGGAPHSAVIALQLTLALALFIGLFGSLHLGGERG